MRSPISKRKGTSASSKNRSNTEMENTRLRASSGTGKFFSPRLRHRMAAAWSNSAAAGMEVQSRKGPPSIIHSLARRQASAPQKSRETCSRNVTLLRSQPRRENEKNARPMHKTMPAHIPPRKK